jgi:hypothetical protein
VITDTRLGDHATGLELQIEELVDRRERARREGWPSQVRVLDGQITELQVELAANTHYSSATIHLPPAQ